MGKVWFAIFAPRSQKTRKPKKPKKPKKKHKSWKQIMWSMLLGGGWLRGGGHFYADVYDIISKIY